MMTEKETALTELLGKCHAKFTELPRQHPMEQREFCEGIHRLQAMVMARPTAWEHGWVPHVVEEQDV